MIRPALTALTALGVLAAGAARAELPPLETVRKVDLSRYLGTWYEIARLPARFQKDCFDSVAQYNLREDGDLEVVNRCRKGSPTGKLKVAKGKAWVVDKQSNAKLKVQFFWPFRGDYWVIELGPDYEYTVVGEPGREYLWVLSRTPAMPREKLDAILDRAKAQGYDLSEIIINPAPNGS